MAKSRRKQGHVRLTCPHCGRSVSVQRPQRFQAAMPCPNCRLPIDAALITAAEAALERSKEQSSGSESAPAESEETEEETG